MPMGNLHICLLSVHGLIRSHDLELGRDADTGGQVRYVIELARALSAVEDVCQVDLVTRLIDSPQVDNDYSQTIEALTPKASIVRIKAGGTEYLPKEALWQHLDSFTDHLIDYYRDSNKTPDVVHTHYADAGYVGSKMAHMLGIPLIHTGHSLGRVKRKRLIASGLDSQSIDARYNMARRIVAEEQTLATADCVITSTHQEIQEQYEIYNCYRREVMRVIPPGTNWKRYKPPVGNEFDSHIADELSRFLREPEKPMILALSRADTKKNIAALLQAYGESADLQRRANLVLVLGNRQDIFETEEATRQVYTHLLRLIDRYDLYGKVAYPKKHASEEVPVLYRLAATTRGVFVNPAITEPFGLTLIEAAASGLPIVATEDGGPKDIVDNCNNGLLIDPLEPNDISSAITRILDNSKLWQQYSQAGIKGVKHHYSWPAHAQQYVRLVNSLVELQPSHKPSSKDLPVPETTYIDRALFTDLNGCLLGDNGSLAELKQMLLNNRKRMKFCVTTGLRQDAAYRLIKRHDLPAPDVLITSAGTEVTFAPGYTPDVAWKHHIEKQWTPYPVQRVMDNIKGIRKRSASQQSMFKISYEYDPVVAPSIEAIREQLLKEDQYVTLIQSHGKFLNVVPLRASKGLALRYVAKRFGITLNKVLAIGGSGADEDMVLGNTLAAIVGNSNTNELATLTAGDSLYFSKERFAAGILEAIQHYQFLDPHLHLEPDLEVVP